jgi:hypothetical protein
MSATEKKPVKDGDRADVFTGTWKDRRAAHRAKARRELERVRRGALKRAASASRKDAIARGAPRYVGLICPHHPSNGIRYTSSHHCIECDRETADRRRQAAGVYQGQRRKPRAPRRDMPLRLC